MPDNKHVFLVNEKAINPKFNRQRGRNDDEQTPEVAPQPKFIKDFQKENFRIDNINFYSQRKRRNENRTIKFSRNIDLIRIFFHTVFNSDLNKKFERNYGLSAMEYSHFNKTVIFEIINESLFKVFENHIKQVVESLEGTPYENQPFNLIALILKFEFIGSRERLLTSKETGILLTLISSANAVSINQRDTLTNLLKEQNINVIYNPLFPDILGIKGITRQQSKFIADNFDIVRMVTSTRALKVRPGVFGTTRREFGFTINVPENLTIVGVIDTGVARIAPFKDVLLNNSYDHTNSTAYWDEVGHGTMVAGLVILGDEFQIKVKEEYNAKAKIIPIKALHSADDDINIPQLLADVKNAKKQHGVRLFNLSLNMPFAKKYNDTYSHFAYELDKLAYEEDILIFISVGNFDKDSLEDLIVHEPHPDHEYPTFFYNLNSTSSSHKCQNTNISEPAESLNNISIGALAGNLEDGDYTDITPNSIYPAYYSRKFHFDYLQPINKHSLKKNQNNKHLNKPDLVFEGGDLFKYEAGMEILRSPLATDDKFFGRTCGTSLSTPLVTSYAAEILNTYPTLKTQTIKALLINSASYHKKNNLPDFKRNTDALLKSMVGFGKPQKNKLLSTDDNSIVFVIEDEIKAEQILTIPIKLPVYLKDSGNKLKFDISLCYSFLPVKDNHLNYLPVHISFNLVKNVDIKVTAFKEQTEYGIKNGFSWSEDHHGIENRVFSNAQFKSYNLQPNDLQNLGDSVALGLRCLTKNDIPPSHLAHLENKTHAFSIVISITELPEIKANNQLYSKMIACNQIRNISQLEGENIVVGEADLNI